MYTGLYILLLSVVTGTCRPYCGESVYILRAMGRANLAEIIWNVLRFHFEWACA